MVFLWLSHLPMGFLLVMLVYPIKSHSITSFLQFSYGFQASLPVAIDQRVFPPPWLRKPLQGRHGRTKARDQRCADAKTMGLLAVLCHENHRKTIGKWWLLMGFNGDLCIYIYIWIWRFPRLGASQDNWLTMEHPMKMHDLGYHYFRKSLDSLGNLQLVMFQVIVVTSLGCR